MLYFGEMKASGFLGKSVWNYVYSKMIIEGCERARVQGLWLPTDTNVVQVTFSLSLGFIVLSYGIFRYARM